MPAGAAGLADGQQARGVPHRRDHAARRGLHCSVCGGGRGRRWQWCRRDRAGNGDTRRAHRLVGERHFELRLGSESKRRLHPLHSLLSLALCQAAPCNPALACHPCAPQELNQRGSHLLYRDKARRLFLLDVATGERAPLLPHSAYAQWVPGSDCAVAQGHGELCVWYGVGAPDK